MDTGEEGLLGPGGELPMGVLNVLPPGRSPSASLETYPLRAVLSDGVLGDRDFGELLAAVSSKEFWEGLPNEGGLPVSEACKGDMLLQEASDLSAQQPTR